MPNTHTVPDSDSKVWIYESQYRALYLVHIEWQTRFHAAVSDGHSTITVQANMLISSQLADLLIKEKQAVVYPTFKR